MRLAGNRCLEIIGRGADCETGRRVTDRFEVLEVAMGMPGLSLGGRTEDGGYVVETLDIRLPSEVQVTPVRLRLTGECVFQILLGAASL